VKKRAVKEALKMKNEAEKQQILEKRTRATVPETREHQALSEINANIRQLDCMNPLSSGRKCMPCRPEWE